MENTTCVMDMQRYLDNSIFGHGLVAAYGGCLANLRKGETGSEQCATEQNQWATGCALDDPQCYLNRLMWQSSAPAYWWSTDFNQPRTNLGDFYACEQIASMPNGGNQQYCAFNFLSQRFLGLCIPKSCSIDELMLGSDSALVQYRRLYQLDDMGYSESDSNLCFMRHSFPL